MPSSTVDRRGSVSFGVTVAASSTEVLEWEVPRDATVESVTVRMYPGPENDLEVVPFKRDQDTREDRIPLLTLVGKQYVDGDDDVYEFRVSEAVAEEEILGVEAVNTNADSDYNIRVNMTVDYAGGTNRLLGSLRDMIPGGA